MNEYQIQSKLFLLSFYPYIQQFRGVAHAKDSLSSVCAGTAGMQLMIKLKKCLCVLMGKRTESKRRYGTEGASGGCTEFMRNKRIGL
jgi:hypothetical protein